jgi:secretion/DNA translocation related TadE-like protein
VGAEMRLGIGRRADDASSARDATPTSARSGERGIATVLALGWIAVILTVGWIAAIGAAVAAAQHRIDGAADLAALSAAQAVQSGHQDGCAVAAHVASSNGVTVRDCRRDGVDVVVTVADELDLPWSLDGAITATARAGP